jgi:hypothetical protein
VKGGEKILTSSTCVYTRLVHFNHRAMMSEHQLSKQTVKKHVSAIHIKAKLSLVQRKMVNALLFNSYDSLLTADEHSLPVPLLCELVGIDGNNINHLKRALKSLTTTSITWDVLDDNGDSSWSFAALLSGGTIKNGICTYRYDKGLAKELYNPEIYSRINLGVIKKIKTSHTLVLYENCYRFISIGHTGWWDIDTLRDIMGLSESKSYSAFKDLNKHVLKPAISEVNQVSNIIIEMEYKRTGRAISGVRFLVRSNPQLSFDGMQDENEIDKTAIFKRFLKIHYNKTLARKMIAEFGAEQIAKNLDYVEAQIAQGKVRSAPAFLKSSIQNNFLSEDARTSERRKIIENKAHQMRVLEEAKNKREAKAKEVDRAYSTACIEAMERAFIKLGTDEQRSIETEFLDSSDFGSFQITDFRRNGWASRMVLSQAIKFWMRKKIPLPRMDDISKKFGIEDFEAYKSETSKMSSDLEKA